MPAMQGISVQMCDLFILFFFEKEERKNVLLRTCIFIYLCLTLIPSSLNCFSPILFFNLFYILSKALEIEVFELVQDQNISLM